MSDTAHHGDSTDIVTNVQDLINGIIVTTQKDEFSWTKYGFAKVHQTHDVVNGDVADNAVVYTGRDDIAVYYTAGESLADVPQSVIDRVSEDYEIIEGQDAGWSKWDGRPEFSETYFEA